MNISNVSSAAQTSATGTDSFLNGDPGGLNADSFMKLLLAELQTQDPLDPMDTQAMVSQLATLQIVADNRMARESQEFTQATNLLGRQITWQDPDSGAVAGGEVSGVRRSGSEAKLVVGDTTISVGDVLTVF
jgi:flagellar basal-body rod modification protein FlgD